jgi:predicted glycosyltransferase
MKIMLYSQHILGIGHFFRSMAIARALSKHEVLFVEGGEPLPGFVAPPHVKRFVLPALMMDAEFKAMEVREGSIEETKALRSKLLMKAFLDFAPQVLVTELFPFGRRQFRFELMPLLRAIQEHRLQTRVVCSLRDILVEKSNQTAYEAWVLEVLNRYYGLLLVHADSRLVSLDESFSRVDRISIPIHYTGFVTRPLPTVEREPGRRVIVASSGGGKVGFELLAATMEAVRGLPDPDLLLRVFMGPFMEKPERDCLEDLAGKDPRTTAEPFATDFLAQLLAADLSVSMAGYNTCMDLLNTGIKALVYPFRQNREQGLRAEKLESLGLVRVIHDLEKAALAHTIKESLGSPLPPVSCCLNLDGAVNTAALIAESHAP